jgi:lipid II:glycine glycyltransferase (peptidoglycan interpeptide bridge formation enzyme)
MFITERKFGIFKFLNIYFSDEPSDSDFLNYDTVTYHTNKNWGSVKGFDRTQCLSTTIDLNQDLEVIWSKVKRLRKRHILRAERNGTRVLLSTDYEGFHKIYEKFLKEKNFADPFGLVIFPLIFMQKYGILFIAEDKGEILGGNLYFHDDQNALCVCTAYQTEGNSIEKNKQISDANSYIHWKALQYFKSLGINSYDLGGLGCKEITSNHRMHGLDLYKLSFGGNIVSQYQYVRFNSGFNKFLFRSWNFLRTLK